jgi:large subunit ribosomal protein L30
MAAELKITLLKSHIGQTKAVRAVLNGMGLTRREKTVLLKNTPEIRGMVAKVAHMLKVEE